MNVSSSRAECSIAQSKVLVLLLNVLLRHHLQRGDLAKCCSYTVEAPAVHGLDFVDIKL